MDAFLPPEPRLSLADWRHAERLFHTRRESLTRIDLPMVLVSQIQRSGGTLVNSLLDGHPQLHVHPWEIQIGHPTKADWPRLDLDAGADEWLETLRQPWLARTFETGYDKAGPTAEQSVPVTIVPSLVDSLFRLLVTDDPPKSSREVLDSYFTALFGAWFDCRGLWDGPKRWLAGFCPRLAWGESRRRWRADYPDGMLVAVLRDPRAWYASARAQAADGPYDDLDDALAQWQKGAEEIGDAKRAAPDRVFVMTYEQLIGDPESVTRDLAAWLGIDWVPSLLEPTFNRQPIPPNSSFDVAAGGIRTESVERWRQELDDREQSLIAECHLPAYEAVSALAETGGADRGSKRAAAGRATSAEASRRARFVAEAAEHAPYLGATAGESVFIVRTGDNGVDRGLFVKQARPEFRVLSRAARAVRILAGDDVLAGRAFVDVGANIGTATVHALVSEGFASAVACEPEEENFRLLRANVALNDLEDRVRSLRVAVSSEPGTSELVVLEGRRGASWIATDTDQIRAAEAVRERRIAEDPKVLDDPRPRAPAEVAEMSVVEVEVVTLDGLLDSGAIDLASLGMLWIDAEGHEGHILEGAGKLAGTGVPIVFEFHPSGLEQRGDRDRVHAVAAECYTHFVDVRRGERGHARFELREVADLPEFESRFLDPATPVRFTDLLLLRLDQRQARVGASLPDLLASSRAGSRNGA